ncbi:MAG: amino acid ABC transporter permease [Planctomycetes bacterium]|nr:amino acid ABC transporter permease [Planctomycetota bacterium]
MDFRHYVFADPYFGWLLRGVAVTLLIAVLTTAASLLLGFMVASRRLSRQPFWRTAGVVYVAVFRNLPPLPLLLFLLFGLPQAFRAATGMPLPAGAEFPLLIAGLSLNTSAYLAETIRSGVRAVPTEQWDAGRVLGLRPRTVLLCVIYPQALRIALPALGTRLIHNMKNSSLALALPLPVGCMEVVGQAGRIAGQTFAWTEPLLFAAAVYMTLALSLGFVVSRLSRGAQRRVEVLR